MSSQHPKKNVAGNIQAKKIFSSSKGKCFAQTGCDGMLVCDFFFPNVFGINSRDWWIMKVLRECVEDSLLLFE